MLTPILHHYASSPFSEKVRLILGYKKIAWAAVTVPMMNPKPDVLALTGGYRKTPFLQIGSHIYCDTALICEVLEQLQPTPTLYPSTASTARALAQWADEKIFWAAMAHNFHPKGVAQMFGGGAPEQWAERAKVFADDRAKMRVAVPRLPPADAQSVYALYLAQLAQLLEHQPYLLGGAPCVADFSAYHPLWFTRTQTTVMADILSSQPKVLAWMDRLAAIGHGQHQTLSAQESIALCASHAGQGALLPSGPWVDSHGLEPGTLVSVAAEAFGPEPSVGQLVACTASYYSLRREDERAGQVHVHLPRIGYILKKVQP